MQFYDDMRSKHGFEGGNIIPEGMEDVRKLYITVINKYAEEFGSDYRAIAYDRPYGHNWCLIMFIHVKDIDLSLPLTDPNYVTWDETVKLLCEFGDTDEALKEAVDEAENADLDNYVRIKASVDWEGWEEQVYEE